MNISSDALRSAVPMTVPWCASLACVLEVTAPKPGNVHRGADFATSRFEDYLVSAHAFGFVLAQSESKSLGQIVLDSVVATRHWVGTNTNLGLILLIAPLARAAMDASGKLLEKSHVEACLAQLTPQDAAHYFSAIRLAAPGGLGSADRFDVQGKAPGDLLEAMGCAADRDWVARQYTTGFSTVFDTVTPWILESIQAGLPLSSAIIHTQMRLMASVPDSLIGRKCGREIALESATRAGNVLRSGPPDSAAYLQALADLDFWLRCDGNRRNPGTTADLIGAALFLALHNRWLTCPLQ